MRIATHNVNGIRPRSVAGLSSWLEARHPDVIALQEVRCPVESLPAEAFGPYHVTYDPGTLAGRNGVAVLTRRPPVAVRGWAATVFGWSPGREVGLVEPAVDFRLARELRHFAGEGRYLEVDLADAPVTVASVYVPKGDSPRAPRDKATASLALARYERKMAFLTGFARQLAANDARQLDAAGSTWSPATSTSRTRPSTCETGAPTRTTRASCRLSGNGSPQSSRHAHWLT